MHRPLALPSNVTTVKLFLERLMSDSVYKIIELVGTSPDSWEAAARNAVEKAAESLANVRIAEIVKLDMTVSDSKVIAYRARVSISFKLKDSAD